MYHVESEKSFLKKNWKSVNRGIELLHGTSLRGCVYVRNWGKAPSRCVGCGGVATFPASVEHSHARAWPAHDVGRYCA